MGAKEGKNHYTWKVVPCRLWAGDQSMPRHARVQTASPSFSTEFTSISLHPDGCVMFQLGQLHCRWTSWPTKYEPLMTHTVPLGTMKMGSERLQRQDES